MSNALSRRTFLSHAGVAAGWAALPRGTPYNALPFGSGVSASPEMPDRIVDMHVHFDEKNPSFTSDLLKLSDRLNLTACVLTPFPSRKVILDAAKQHPRQIIPFGSVTWTLRT